MLKYQPKPGTIARCDFRGYIIPEIIKNRAVLVINSHKRNAKLVTVVPISATIPISVEYYHHQLDVAVESSLAPYLKNIPRWFKCDLVYVVSIERMDRLKNRITGKRNTPKISNQILEIVKEKVKMANGL